MDLTVLIPVYNGENTIERLHERLRHELSEAGSYEVLFIHDSGRDNSWEIIRSLAEANPGTVKGFRLKRNYGQHNAILFGITRASGKFIVTLDEDLQHDPAVINALLEKQREGDYDVVYAAFNRLRHPGFRILTSEMLRRYLSNRVPGINPEYTSFRLMKREVAIRLSGLSNSYTFIDGSIGLMDLKTTFTMADHYRRADGKSSYSYYKLFRHAWRIAISYTKLRKRLLWAALSFLPVSVVVFVIQSSGYPDGAGLPVFMFTAAAGLLLFLAWLFAERDHRRGLGENLFPVEVEVV
ncbi:MAG: glycosyltransferase family 2 protein [Bacteroidales bacterium]|jgi:undecaprenyl-phosphate 4-deoxy-4-formamido-L-arabinose transferase|nr:glycosyltransferase family 2 protein [Bacteroidales bacterium]